VNADDFGMSPRINHAILQAFENGLISSATIMANMPAFEDACQIVGPVPFAGAEPVCT